MEQHLYFFLIIMLILLCTVMPLTSKNFMEQSKLNIVPKPLVVQPESGDFVITPETKIIVTAANDAVVGVSQYLAEKIRLAADYNVTAEPISPSGNHSNSIVFTQNTTHENLGDEGYSLEVRPVSIAIRANKPAGFFYGVQTLLQLLPPEFNSVKKVPGLTNWTIPCVSIYDKPRFSWRGMHLDVCRHFFPKEFIKSYIDYLAMHKMNVFHWHLTEDQGWRIEIKKYPKLTQIGAWRADRTGITWDEREPQQPGEKATYGGYYTQAEVKEIVDHAQKRFITIVPEIEMPGHSLAALASYPEYSCTGGPFSVATGGYWPIVDVFCPGKDETFKFLENILDEVIELFPGPYVHIGGDEVNKANWQKCPHCQKRIKDEGLKNEAELQSYFIKRIEKFLLSRNRKLIGWDEILEGGLAPAATVMSWRGMQGGIEAAQAQHDVIMSPTSHCYLNNFQGQPSREPEAAGGFLPIEKVYEFEPTPPELTPDQSRQILGAQGNVWTEYISTPELVEYMIFPRMCALAEVVWSAKELCNLDDFLNRLSFHYLRLDAMAVNYREPDLQGLNETTVFIDDVRVDIINPRPYGTIRFTLDGSEPTHTAQLYSQPFNLTETTLLKVRVFGPDGKPGKIQESLYEKQVPLPATPVKKSQPGVNCQYYELDDQVKSTQDLKNFTSQKIGTTGHFTLPEMNYPEYFGIIFNGLIHVPSDGVYTFTTRSNDGSRLYINDNLIVDNDGLHGELEQSGQVALAQGEHSVRVEYFQGGASKILKVYYQGPELAKTEIPATILRHEGN